MSIKLLREHYLEFLSLIGGYTGSSESTLVKLPHCCKSRVTAQIRTRKCYLLLGFSSVSISPETKTQRFTWEGVYLLHRNRRFQTTPRMSLKSHLIVAYIIDQCNDDIPREIVPQTKPHMFDRPQFIPDPQLIPYHGSGVVQG